jgi:hypothetical protein
VRQGGSNYPLLTVKVEQADGYEAGVELKVHAFGTVLYKEVLRQRPAPGDPITISYQGQGKDKGPGQNPPELYRVRAGGTKAVGSIYDRLAGDEPKPEPDVPITGQAGQDEIPF